MIEFRQKSFGNIFKAAGEKMKPIVDNIKNNKAVAATAAAAPTAIGLANLELNVHRKREDTKLRKEQIEAMDNLTRAIQESDRDSRVKKAAKSTRVSFRKKHPEDLNDEDLIILPNPVSKITKFKKKNKK
jgi:hypothetical protein